MQINSKQIVGVTVLLTALIAGAAFILSFTALRDLAAHHGVPEDLALLFPLLADAVVIAASLSVIARQMDGLGTRYQMALVGLFTALSVGLNAWHAITRTKVEPLPIVIAVIPPLALFLTFELLAAQLQKTIERYGLTQTLDQIRSAIEEAKRGLDDFLRAGQEQRDALTAEIVMLTAQRDALAADIEQLRRTKRVVKRQAVADMTAAQTESAAPARDNQADNVTDALPRAVRLDLIRRDIASANGHGAPSASEIADKYKISIRQARRDLAEIAATTTEVN